MPNSYYKGREYLLKNRLYGGGLYSSPFAGLLSNTSVVPEDKTIGVDVSHWYGLINWFTMRSKGIRFAITKATDIGWHNKGFIDDKAIRNYTLSKQEGILTGAYHWLDPRTDPYYQADYFLNEFYSKYPTDFPPALDFEDANVISYSDMLWRAQVWLAIVEQETGRTPLLYTSPGYMMNFDKSKTGFLSHYPLWNAHYIQRTYPLIAYPWEKYTIWQYSDRGHYPYYIWNDPKSGRGKEYGGEAYSLDMNWFDGNYDALLNFVSDKPAPPVPPEEPTTPVDEFDVMCTTHALTVRKGPGSQYEVRRYIVFGDVEHVEGIQGGWYKIGEDEWISSRYTKKMPSGVWFRAQCLAYKLYKRGGPGTQYDVVGHLEISLKVH